MAGGLGTRLWPLSRASRPKQFLPLVTGQALIADTAGLVANYPGTLLPIIVTGETHGFATRRVLEDAKLPFGTIILEPFARSTAPVAAIAALLVAHQARDTIIALLAADHAIRDRKAFGYAFERAASVAREGVIALFGVPPSEPSSRYGYVRCGVALGETAYRVESFVEKPDVAAAARFIANGNYLWNSGNFVFRADVMIEELTRHAPDILAACEAALAGAHKDGAFLHLDATAMEKCRAISLDHAVMEKTGRAAVVRLNAGWSDIGTWDALWELATKDDANNAVEGEAVIEDCKGLYIYSRRGVVGAIGLRDLVIVADDDAVLVAPRERDQDVGVLVQRLRAENRVEVNTTRKVERPWGSYEVLQAGEGFQVKLIEVRPGHAISLQYHQKRSEHWVVIRGIARITVDETVCEYGAGEAVFVPVGAKHRIENMSDKIFAIIEVQIGSYLGEDDIVRIEDRYGRV